MWLWIVSVQTNSWARCPRFRFLAPVHPQLCCEGHWNVRMEFGNLKVPRTAGLMGLLLLLSTSFLFWPWGTSSSWFWQTCSHNFLSLSFDAKRIASSKLCQVSLYNSVIICPIPCPPAAAPPKSLRDQFRWHHNQFLSSWFSQSSLPRISVPFTLSAHIVRDIVKALFRQFQ